MKKFNLIYVDKGASQRIGALKSLFNFNNYNEIFCEKKRNLITGEILSLEIECEDLENLPCIIIDDLVDAGGSFINCIKKLQTIKGYTESYLIVTHGIFSKGIEPLAKYFKRIYCTNSYKDVAHPIIKQYDIYDNEQIRTATF